MTMASSTTMPIASTMPNSVDRLTVKPSAAIAGERADDGDRHCRRRHQRGAEVLQEYQDDDQHQNPGLVQRLVDLVDRVLDESRRVVGDGITAGPPGSGCDSVAIVSRDLLADLQRVGLRRLIDGDAGGRLAVQLEILRIGLRAEFDACRRR